VSWRRQALTFARIHAACARLHALTAIRLVQELRDAARAGDVASAWQCALRLEEYRALAREDRRQAAAYAAIGRSS
jgi:hypothetical protein